MLIRIKNLETYDVIFEFDKENNTVKETVEEAVRQGVSLRGANLTYVNLSGADLRGADLRESYLYRADLTGADLTGADITNCYFDKAILNNTVMPDFPIACPETGSFIGYKKIYWTSEYADNREFIVKLEIPEDAKRSSATTSKCRCSKAKVLEIRDMVSGKTVNSIININMLTCVYKVGKYVYPDKFDECRWNECSNGIHFFMTEDEALYY